MIIKGLGYSPFPFILKEELKIMNNQEIKLKALFIRLCIKLELAFIRKDNQEIDDLLDVLTIIHKYMGEDKNE